MTGDKSRPTCSGRQSAGGERQLAALPQLHLLPSCRQVDADNGEMGALGRPSSLGRDQQVAGLCRLDGYHSLAHLATLALLTLSWTTQMHRIGSLVILVHDFADHWMELAKMARYANLNVKNGNKNGKLFTVHIFRASVTSVL